MGSGLSKCHNTATSLQNTQAKPLVLTMAARAAHKEIVERLSRGTSTCITWYQYFCSLLDPRTCSFHNPAKYLAPFPLHTFWGSAPYSAQDFATLLFATLEGHLRLGSYKEGFFRAFSFRQTVQWLQVATCLHRESPRPRTLAKDGESHEAGWQGYFGLDKGHKRHGL